MSDIEVDTDGVQALIGRTIIKADREPPSEDEWPTCDESLTLTLDDGSVWEFFGHGYDTGGLQIVIRNAADIPELRHLEGRKNADIR